MSPFLIALFIAVFIGFGFILYAVYVIVNEKDQKEEKSNFGYFELDNTIKAIDKSVQEADDALEHLDKMAKTIFEEMESKHQELLFLYTLIDDKRQNMAEDYRISNNGKKVKTNLVLDEYNAVDIERNPIKNAMLDRINEMTKNGLSITEISKNLNMGQGEVKLIMELGRDR